MDIPDANVNPPEQVQKFLAKMKEFVESSGGKVEFSKMGPVPGPIYSDRATGAARAAQDCRLENYARGVRGPFGNS